MLQVSAMMDMIMMEECHMLTRRLAIYGLR